MQLEEERRPLKQAASEKMEILDVMSEVRRVWVFGLRGAKSVSRTRDDRSSLMTSCLLAARVIFHFLRLFRKLQARSHEAKVVALSAVVEGKDVESEAMLLRRELEGEPLLSFLPHVPCVSR